MRTRTLLLVFMLMGGLAVAAWAQRRQPRTERVGDGILLTVLRKDAIPAIRNPQFVSADEADRFMANKEPVLGLYDGQVAKAYSLWHLDGHEIVNDSMQGFGPIAVTW